MSRLDWTLDTAGPLGSGQDTGVGLQQPARRWTGHWIALLDTG